MMSLTQKAKKKFFGSLSKKKKVKTSEGKTEKPTPLPRSRPPLPVFMSPVPSFEENIGNLHTSTSLPDQLDRFGMPEVSIFSSQSMLQLETDSSTFGEMQYLVETGRSKSSSGRSTTASEIPSVTLRSDLTEATKLSSTSAFTEPSACSVKDTLNFRIQQAAHNSDHKSDQNESIQERICYTENSQYSDGSLTSMLKSDSNKTGYRNDRFNPRSPPSLEDIVLDNVEGEKFVNSLFTDIINRYNYHVFKTPDEDINVEDIVSIDDNIILSDDSAVFDEVFEPDSKNISSCISIFNDVEANSGTPFRIGTSENKIETMYNHNNIGNTADAKGNKRQYICDIKIDGLHIVDVTRVPRMSNSVLKKIKFFETYNGSININGDIVNKTTAVSPRHKRPFSDHEEETQKMLHKFTKNKSVRSAFCSKSDNRPGAPDKDGRLRKPGTSFRLLKNPTFSSSRLNFSRFRSSSSIPEVVAMCGCGQYCEEECIACMGTQSSVSDGFSCRDYLDTEPRRRLITTDKVCHHPQCTDDNSGLPLMLCRQCDLDIHKNPEYSGHLVLDTKIKRGQTSVRPTSPVIDYEEDTDSDTQQPVAVDRVDGVFVKHNSQMRNKIPSTELERKLKRKMALKKKGKNELDVALAQIADPEGFESSQFYRMDSETSEYRQMSDLSDNSVSIRTDSIDSPTEEIQVFEYASLTSRVPVRRQSRVSVHDGHFTLKFGSPDGAREDLEVVAAVPHTTLREAIEPVLIRRNMDVNTVNVFIEKSKTPLPMSSESVFLAGNILEVKEKDDTDLETSGQGKSRTGHSKSSGSKGNKQSGRSSRRDSVGVVSLLLEPPPTKQRRGSLQLPFREHFFNKGDSKNPDGLKVLDDNFGSLRGRTRSGNLSVDDTFYPAISPGGSLSEAKRGKSPKLSVVTLFTPTNKDRERQDQLSEILNRYSLHGLPPYPELLAFGRPKFDDAIFEMEPNWKSVVDNHQNMTKKQQEHQEAVWELLLTEVSYIKQIRVIIDVFQTCLINVQQESFLNEIETERLFSNIDKVFECNCMFWMQYLLPVLHHGRECRQPLDPLLSKEGFVDHFASFFQVYFKYFIEHKSCQDYAKSCMESSDLFKTFIQWAETQKQCNRLKLADILVKPMQRLLKYSLLLQAILKHTENDKDRTDIKEMIQSVDKLCWAANNSLRRREDYEKLEAVRRTIEPIDAIEAPNDECAKIIQEYNGNFNLLAPMPGFRDGPRSLLFHSSLRMREAQNIKLDVDCLLFTDLILICKPNKRMERFKIIRPPMRLDQLVVSELKDKGSFLLIYINEYHVPISAFTFHSDMGAIRGWLEKFREAQRNFKMIKLQENAELELIRSDTTASQVDMESSSMSSVPSYLDLVSSTLPRSESAESADRFMPNLLTPSDLSSDNGQFELHSGSPADFQNHPTDLAAHGDLTHANTDHKFESLIVAETSPSSRHRTGNSTMEVNSQGGATKHKPVQSSRSVPNIMVGNDNADAPTTASPLSKHGIHVEDIQSFHEMSDTTGHHSYSLSASGYHIDNNHSLTIESLSEQNSIIAEEELAKLKLNSRRVSRTEKRYHTADAIQDMKHYEKDSSIHKRLSWRTDVPVMDNKNMDSRAISADSVRSIPSSSGVSSTGSLHLPMETEICEERERSSNGSRNSPARIDRLQLFSVGDAEDIDDDDDGHCPLSDSKQNKSKSTSDLVTMFSNSLQVSQMEDGIASVAVSTDGFNRKLTHAEILKMKKLKHQILYDANIESSEV